MRLSLIASVALSLALSGAASARTLAPPYGVFNEPAKIETRALPKDKLNPQANPHITCTRYASFMVKEVDLGEKGADKLAILPAKAPCVKDDSDEIPIRIEGYFKGVIGDYIFFDASDGWDGGVPFYVFDPEGTQLFEDSAVDGKFASASVESKKLQMSFDRVYHAPCSMYVHRADCDNQIMAETILGGEGAGPNLMLPDCKEAYDAVIKENGWKYADAIKTSNSVIRYPVELEFDGEKLTIEPTGISPAVCSAPE